LELGIPTPATTMTWCLGLAITSGFIEKSREECESKL